MPDAAAPPEVGDPPIDVVLRRGPLVELGREREHPVVVRDRVGDRRGFHGHGGRGHVVVVAAGEVGRRAERVDDRRDRAVALGVVGVEVEVARLDRAAAIHVREEGRVARDVRGRPVASHSAGDHRGVGGRHAWRSCRRRCRSCRRCRGCRPSRRNSTPKALRPSTAALLWPSPRRCRAPRRARRSGCPVPVPQIRLVALRARVSRALKRAVGFASILPTRSGRGGSRCRRVAAE